MGYLDKINVGGTNYDLGAKLEHITDSAGHNRFIDGDVNATSITNCTFPFKGWALSGTHLIIVYCVASSTSSVTIPTGNLAEIDLPQWIIDKIFPIRPSAPNTLVAYSQMVSSDAGEGAQTHYLKLLKDDGHIYIYNGTELSWTNYRCGRVQFDLLITND